VPSGARRNDPDPRGLISSLGDMNITDAVDSLLQANRARLVSEFDLAELRWNDHDCRDESRNLPRWLCDDLAQKAPSGVLRLVDKLVFYHLGFDDVLPREDDTSPEAQARRVLKRALDRIPTSLQLDADDADHIDEAMDLVIKPQNQCLQQLKQLLQAASVGAAEVQQARCACVDQEGRKLLELPAEPAVNAAGRSLMCSAPQTRQ
jgi:virulence-associated protein VagC